MLGLRLGLNRSKRVFGDEFSIEGLSGLIHWWKHNTDLYNISDEFPGDDEGVYKWLDQIGGEHGVAQTESSRPKYVLSETSLNFNGAAKVLTVQSRVEDAGGNIDLGSVDNWSIWCRIKFGTTPNNTDYIVKDEDDSTEFIRVMDATTIRVKMGTATQYNFTVSTMGTSQYYNIALQFNGTTNKLHCYLSGTGTGRESTTGGISCTEEFQFDTIKGGLNDDFRTLIVCSEFLGSSDRTNLFAYLNANN